MHPLPTSQHFSSIRTDEDINAAVTQFLADEGSKLHGKTWQDTTAEVTQWLASQIQREREGWRQKTRAAMQEIETHRRETLRYQAVVQESLEQMKIVAEICNVPAEVIQQISEQDPKQALPIYIQQLTEILNSLMEDRIMCLQILRADDQMANTSLPNLLKAYIEALKHHAERAHKEAKSRLDSLESVNKQSYGEMQKLKKAVMKKQEEVERLHAKLQEIKDVTLKKFKEVNEITKKSFDGSDKSSVGDGKLSQKLSGRRSTSSQYSAPTPPPVIDEANIQISEEKLSKLRRSAKKLESSLNDALSQMDTFRKGMRPAKVPPATTMFASPKPTPTATIYASPKPAFVPEIPLNLKKDMKLLPSALQTWSTKFEVSGPLLKEAEIESKKMEKEKIEREKQEKKQKAKEKRREALMRSHNQLETPPTFRSLMKTLDEVKKNKTARNFKPVGQVTKCLRCNKLFTLNDNHKKSCNYHPKGKERIEQYSDRGKLVKVSYVWKCCMMGPEHPGCCYGQHV